jgi:hypothetical protein
MYSRFQIAIGMALLLSLIVALPAFAGGWAVITLDELPANIVAGEPVSIGFMVRQHGHTPMDGLFPTITATHSRDAQFVVDAEPGGKAGHYTATLAFPEAGEWRWSIQAFSMDQTMPVLNVAPAGIPSVSGVQKESSTSSLSLVLWIRMLALIIGIAGLVLANQRRSRLIGALAGLALLVGIGTFLMGVTLEAAAQSKMTTSIEKSPSQVELGRQLFIAKGCITCHYNDRAASRSEYWTIEMGAPDLSRYSSSPEVLFVRLKDPAAAKSDTKMPNLELKKTEIEALIAFINSK